MTYPALPTLTARAVTEPVLLYGARALMFLLQHRCDATLDDDTLAQADSAARIAVAAKDVSQPALRNISDVRTMIALTLRRRKTERAERLAQFRDVEPDADGPDADHDDPSSAAERMLTQFAQMLGALVAFGKNGPGPQRVAPRKPSPNVPPSNGAAVAIPKTPVFAGRRL